VAGVPLGDVLVKDIKAVNISGSDCLTASLLITGVDGAYIRVGGREGVQKVLATTVTMSRITYYCIVIRTLCHII